MSDSPVDRLNQPVVTLMDCSVDPNEGSENPSSQYSESTKLIDLKKEPSTEKRLFDSSKNFGLRSGSVAVVKHKENLAEDDDESNPRDPALRMADLDPVTSQ